MFPDAGLELRHLGLRRSARFTPLVSIHSPTRLLSRRLMRSLKVMEVEGPRTALVPLVRCGHQRL